MSIRFDDKVAIITGAGRGLGRSYALFLASRGAKIVVNDVGTAGDGTSCSKAPAQMVIEEIRDNGGDAVANFDDVAKSEGARRIVNDALKHFGTVDILINNAGVLRDKTFLNMTLDDFEFVVKVHLLGTVYVTKAAFPVMRKKGYGRILMTTSIAGPFGSFGQTNYSTAKMGVIGFMNSLKLEGEKYNILVNTIAPLAATRLGELSGIFPKEIIPFIQPELVTPVVAYLCSEQCQTSGHIISAGGRYYSRIQVVEGTGVRFAQEQEITPELICENYTQITNMDRVFAFKSATESFLDALGPLMK